VNNEDEDEDDYVDEDEAATAAAAAVAAAQAEAYESRNMTADLYAEDSPKTEIAPRSPLFDYDYDVFAWVDEDDEAIDKVIEFLLEVLGEHQFDSQISCSKTTATKRSSSPSTPTRRTAPTATYETSRSCARRPLK
jgi:hypothetical protein